MRRLFPYSSLLSLSLSHSLSLSLSLSHTFFRSPFFTFSLTLSIYSFSIYLSISSSPCSRTSIWSAIVRTANHVRANFFLNKESTKIFFQYCQLNEFKLFLTNIKYNISKYNNSNNNNNNDNNVKNNTEQRENK